MATQQTLPAADFQKLPLEYLISAPLVAAVEAQKQAAQATRSYIESFLNKVDGQPGVFTPQTVNFNFAVQEPSPSGTGVINRNVALAAPLLSMVPVPHLRIDSLSIHFKYEVTEVVGIKKDTTISASADASIKYLPIVEASLKGNLSSTSSENSSTNRSGLLEITVHASEAPIPEGLARLLSLLAKFPGPTT